MREVGTRQFTVPRPTRTKIDCGPDKVKTAVPIMPPQKWDHLREPAIILSRTESDGDWVRPSLVLTGLWRPAVDNSNSQMCLHLSFSSTVARRVLWTYGGATGNTGSAVSLGLMNSEENYSWRSQRTINTLIRINGNRITFSPDTVIALYQFFLFLPFIPVKFPISPSCCCCFCVSFFFDPIFFFETCRYFSSSLNPMRPSRKSWDMEHSQLSTPAILCVLYSTEPEQSMFYAFSCSAAQTDSARS